MLQPSIPIIDQHIPVIGIVPPALGGGIIEIADADHIWKAVSVQIQDQETMDWRKLAGDRQFDLRKTVAPVVKDSGPQFIYGILNGPVEQPPVHDLMQPRFGKGPVGFKSLVHGWQLLIQFILGCEEAFTAVFVDPRDDLLDGAVAVKIVHVHAQRSRIGGFEFGIQSQIPRQNIRPAVTVQIGQGERVPQSGRAGDFHRTVPGIVDDLEVRPLGSHNQIRPAVAVHVRPPGAGHQSQVGKPFAERRGVCLEIAGPPVDQQVARGFGPVAPRHRPRPEEYVGKAVPVDICDSGDRAGEPDFRQPVRIPAEIPCAVIHIESGQHVFGQG